MIYCLFFSVLYLRADALEPLLAVGLLAESAVGARVFGAGLAAGDANARLSRPNYVSQREFANNLK